MVFKWILLDQFSVNEGLGELRPKQQRNYARNQMIEEETCLRPEVLFCLVTPLSSSSHITHMEIKIYMLMVLINLGYDKKNSTTFPSFFTLLSVSCFTQRLTAGLSSR